MPQNQIKDETACVTLVLIGIIPGYKDFKVETPFVIFSPKIVNRVNSSIQLTCQYS